MIRFSFLLWTMLPTAAKSGKLVCYEERGAVASRVTQRKTPSEPESYPELYHRDP